MNTAEETMEKSTYNKMVDFKKKISLLEGKRKAIYTKMEKEKKINKEREVQLGGDIINAHREYIRSLTTDDTLLSNIPKYPNLNTKVLERLSPNSAVLRDVLKRTFVIKFKPTQCNQQDKPWFTLKTTNLKGPVYQYRSG